jgi:ribose transport system permease protein
LGSIIGFLVLGESIIILLAGLDLSVGAVASFSSVVLAYSMIIFGNSMSVSLVIAFSVVLAILSGAAIGLINGLSVTKLNIPPIIATLGGMWIAMGLAEYIFSGVPTKLEVSSFKLIGRFKVLGVFPLPFLMFMVFAIVSSIILEKTRVGRYVYAVGGSKEAAFLSGLKTDRILITCYTLSGVLSAIGGIFLAAWMIVGDSRGAQGYEFIVITAVVMGGFSLFGGVGNLWDPIIGVFILQTIRKIIPHLRISPFYEEGIVGAILLIAVLINVMSLRRIRS